MAISKESTAGGFDLYCCVGAAKTEQCERYQSTAGARNELLERFANDQGLTVDFTTPIFPTLNTQDSAIEDQDEQGVAVPKIDKPSSWRNGKRELWIMIKSGIPIILTSLLAQSLQMASVLSLGHLGKAELAAASLASMTASITALSVSQGATTALDTLCSQAWGAGRHQALGLHLQRMGILVVVFYFCFVLPVWLNAEHIFNALGQGASLSANAALYLKYLAAGAPGFMLFECVRRYLQAQGIMHASTYCLFIVAPVNAFTNFFLVHRVHLGLPGAAIATAISYWLEMILICLYVLFVDGRAGWGGWSRDVVPIWLQKLMRMDTHKTQDTTGWQTMIKLAIPGIFMVCSDWWSWEVAALAASFLGEAPLAAQAILLTSVSLTFQSPNAVGIAATNRIGNLLGAGYYNTARLASYCGIGLATFLALLNSIVLITFKDSWGYLFNNDPDVLAIVAQVLVLAAAFQLADGLAAVEGGCLRGLGKQAIGSYINIVGYYVIGIPLGLALCFKFDMGLEGIWIGLSAALFLICIMQITVLSRVNWEAESEKARIMYESVPPHEDTVGHHV